MRLDETSVVTAIDRRAGRARAKAPASARRGRRQHRGHARRERRAQITGAIRGEAGPNTRPAAPEHDVLHEVRIGERLPSCGCTAARKTAQASRARAAGATRRGGSSLSESVLSAGRATRVDPVHTTKAARRAARACPSARAVQPAHQCGPVRTARIAEAADITTSPVRGAAAGSESRTRCEVAVDAHSMR